MLIIAAGQRFQPLQRWLFAADIQAVEHQRSKPFGARRIAALTFVGAVALATFGALVLPRSNSETEPAVNQADRKADEPAGPADLKRAISAARKIVGTPGSWDDEKRRSGATPWRAGDLPYEEALVPAPPNHPCWEIVEAAVEISPEDGGQSAMPDVCLDLGF